MNPPLYEVMINALRIACHHKCQISETECECESECECEETRFISLKHCMIRNKCSRSKNLDECIIYMVQNNTIHCTAFIFVGFVIRNMITDYYIHKYILAPRYFDVYKVTLPLPLPSHNCQLTFFI